MIRGLFLAIIFCSCSFSEHGREDNNSNDLNSQTIASSTPVELKWEAGKAETLLIINNSMLSTKDYLPLPDNAKKFELFIPQVADLVAGNEARLSILSNQSKFAIPINLFSETEKGYVIKSEIDYSSIINDSRNYTLNFLSGDYNIDIHLQRMPKRFNFQLEKYSEVQNYFKFDFYEINTGDDKYRLGDIFSFTNNEDEPVYLYSNQNFELNITEKFKEHTITFRHKCRGDNTWNYNVYDKSKIYTNYVKIAPITDSLFQDVTQENGLKKVSPGKTVFLGIFYNLDGIYFDLIQNGGGSRHVTSIHRSLVLPSGCRCRECRGAGEGSPFLIKSDQLVGSTNLCETCSTTNHINMKEGRHSLSFFMNTNPLMLSIFNSNKPYLNSIKKRIYFYPDQTGVNLWAR
tara:strand:- start:362 stop:1570 length:1209 start_codon:yes stop_codon:yes gene_type:complete